MVTGAMLVEEISLYQTPCFIYNADELERKIKSAKSWSLKHNLHLLYAMKANSFCDVLEIFSPHVNGLSVSSPFEALWGKNFLTSDQVIHYSSPLLDFSQALKDLPLLTSANSLNQWNLFGGGIRLKFPGPFKNQNENEFQSAYDPGRKDSHLGVPIEEFTKYISHKVNQANLPQGLSWHSFCELKDFSEFLSLSEVLTKNLGPYLQLFQWLNLGGGFLLEEGINQEDFKKGLDLIRQYFTGPIYFEPGYDLVEGAFCLKTQIKDKIDNKLILDTSINHLPEVMQFKDKLVLKEEDPEGEQRFQLLGCSCLISDSFGEYNFHQTPLIGDELTFLYVGAYSMVKANRFNGINLPSIYRYSENEGYVLRKKYFFEDYCQQFSIK